MKPIVAGLAGIVGIAWFKRRRKPVLPQPDPAEELKAKLAEAREAGDDRREFESGEQPVDAIDERRRDVHDRARAAIDDLSSDS